MGASKTLAEWAVEAAQHRFEQTRFATVRFGNVLGSSGRWCRSSAARSRPAAP